MNRGKLRQVPVKLRSGTKRTLGKFSCVTSFQMRKNDYDQFYGEIKLVVSGNDFRTEVLDSKKRNVNVRPSRPFRLARIDFCNLFLPRDYTLYVQGVRRYSAWVWPDNKQDMYKNQIWSTITTKDRGTLEKAGYGDAIQQSPRKIKAGWLKTHGHGGGACCYFFPNIGGMYCGVKETNLYILPQDLYTMDSLNSA